MNSGISFRKKNENKKKKFNNNYFLNYLSILNYILNNKY